MTDAVADRLALARDCQDVHAVARIDPETARGPTFEPSPRIDDRFEDNHVIRRQAIATELFIRYQIETRAFDRRGDCRCSTFDHQMVAGLNARIPGRRQFYFAAAYDRHD